MNYMTISFKDGHTEITRCFLLENEIMFWAKENGFKVTKFEYRHVFLSEI